MNPSQPERILFITGRLAEPVVRRVVEETSRQAGFDYDVHVLGITVAALLHAEWVGRKLTIDGDFDRAILPGWCTGDIDALDEQFQLPFERGPKDILDLPMHFGREQREPIDLTAYDIEIIAEINHAPRLTDAEIISQAAAYRQSGADVIDIGCVPGESWSRAGDVVRLLRSEGLRVSIDSFDRHEVEAAVDAGAELVLSANSSNVDWLAKLGAEVVAIPDDPSDPASLESVMTSLDAHGCRYRVDPIIEPIGFGFAASLHRFFDVRHGHPDVPMMMGVGNISELAEVDSAGVNLLLAAICQELRIHSVLTTEVINWARSSVAEWDRARRAVKHAVDHQTLPKHIDTGLVMLRDVRLAALGEDALTELASQLTDPNYRIFVERGEIHVMNRDGHWRGTDPWELFQQFSVAGRPLEPSHAFYLGYELSKAVTALTLHKNYVQDEALSWGILTVSETGHRHKQRTPATDGT